MRRTKIVATLGPASSSIKMLENLILTGVDVFRLNFSHGEREQHRQVINAIKTAGATVNRHPAILLDLCGPKIRVDDMLDGGQTLTAGQKIKIVMDKIVGTSEKISCSYSALARDVKTDSRILLDDGNLEFRVLSTDGVNEILCEIVSGGLLKSKKGINLPGVHVSSPSVTDKDYKDIQVGIEEGVDFIALSFVRHPNDILQVKEHLRKNKLDARVIAKIEKPEALECIDEILDVSDGIMVARGDLGVEMDNTSVPTIQKELIEKANEADRYVITATQMLESMIQNSVPTRAEVSDVANAIFDGTDAVMLSGETSVGAYPLEAVDTMVRIAKNTEKYIIHKKFGWTWGRLNPVDSMQDAIGHAAFQLCNDLNPAAVVAFTPTGGTAVYLSKSRTLTPIICFTNNERAVRRMRLYWNIESVYTPDVKSVDDVRHAATSYLRNRPIFNEYKTYLLVCGSQFGETGANNTIEVVSLPPVY